MLKTIKGTMPLTLPRSGVLPAPHGWRLAAFGHAYNYVQEHVLIDEKKPYLESIVEHS
jgi:hypothetical protein